MKTLRVPSMAFWVGAAVTVAASALIGGGIVWTASALADDSAAAPMMGGHGPEHFGHPGMNGPLMMFGHHLEHMKESLGLTAQQAGLWDAAVAKTMPSDELREKAVSLHDHFVAALDEANFDPRHWLDETDKLRAEREARMKESRKAWLAVWDSLDTNQRAIVRKSLHEHATRMGFFMHHPWGEPRDHGMMERHEEPEGHRMSPSSQAVPDGTRSPSIASAS